jgi:hypothetical protein
VSSENITCVALPRVLAEDLRILKQKKGARSLFAQGEIGRVTADGSGLRSYRDE